jgi:hypothetical protein
MSVRRLEAEAVRDAVLAVSGKLSAKMFGPPVPVHENDVGQGGGRQGHEGRACAARSRWSRAAGRGRSAARAYIQVPQSAAGVLETLTRRAATPTARRQRVHGRSAALLMMNSEFVVEQAEAMADRLRKEAPRARAGCASVATGVCGGADRRRGGRDGVPAAQEEQFRTAPPPSPPAPKGAKPALPPDSARLGAGDVLPGPARLEPLLRGLRASPLFGEG